MKNCRDLILLSVAFLWLTNSSFAAIATDQDNDGVADELDNCLLNANPDQYDSDSDGYGNRCDPDIAIPNDLVVNVVDLGVLRAAFLTTPADANWNPDADFNNDGVINVIDLGVMRSLFFSSPGPLFGLRWVSAQSGNWATPENWLPLGPPQAQDNVIIDLPDASPVITISGQRVEVFGLTATESIVIESGSDLVLTGVGIITGSLSISDDSELTAQGSEADVAVNGALNITQGSLRVSSGAAMTLGMTAVTATERWSAWEVSDADSRLALPNLVSITSGDVNIDSDVYWSISARSGGEIDFPMLDNIRVLEHNSSSTERQIIVSAAGNGGRVLMPALTIFDDDDCCERSAFRVLNGGALYAPQLVRADLVDLWISGTSSFDTPQVTSWTRSHFQLDNGAFSAPLLTEISGSTVYIEGSFVDLSSVTTFPDGVLELREGGTTALTNLTDFKDSSVSVYDGVTLVVPITEVLFEARAGWSATGMGSKLVFPNLVAVESGTPNLFGQDGLRIVATNGGLVDAPVLETIYVAALPPDSTAERSVVVEAYGAGSTVQMAALTSFEDSEVFEYDRSAMRAFYSGNIQSPALAQLRGVDVEIHGGSNMNTEQLTSLTYSNLWLSIDTGFPALIDLSGSDLIIREDTIDFPSLTTFRSGSLNLHSNGIVNFPNLTDFDNSSVDVEQGITLMLPITNFRADDRDINWLVQNGTVSLPNLTSITSGELNGLTETQFAIRAGSDGLIDLPALTTIEVRDSGNVETRAIDVSTYSSENSRVQMPSLALFRDDDLSNGRLSTIDSLSGGTVEYPPDATLINVQVSP